MKNENGIEKSAILKGNTLVNLCKLSGMSRPDSSREDVVDIPLHHLKENTQYTVIVNLLKSSDTSIVVGFLNPSGNSWKGVAREISISSDMKMLITTETGLGNKLRIHNNTSTGTLTVKNAIVLEGDYTNADIPYFEGMQSVKMPVLKTTGKNLFDGRLEDGYINSDGTNVGWTNYKRSVNFIKINPKLNYTISKNSSHLGGTFGIFQYDCNNQFISTHYISSTTNVQTFTFDERANYIRIACTNDAQFPIEFVQVEEGSTATEYEPFKSNILTVNEDVTLRGIGDVQDTLDLMTGELTQCIGEVVLDGSENWARYEAHVLDGYSSFITIMPSLNNFYDSDTSFISGDFATCSWNYYVSNKESEVVWKHDPNKIGIRIKN